MQERISEGTGTPMSTDTLHDMAAQYPSHTHTYTELIHGVHYIFPHAAQAWESSIGRSENSKVVATCKSV